ncbi:MAG: site-specific DNA-methyltransferase [Candidatus Aenigmarchaeota archaeon]|nr:site-specific DNA-methyltransferase [Candidatus Aenigmarchaeota archaeon]
MTEEKIKISEAKGRPMLRWVGKKPLDYIKSFPAQLIEIFDATGKTKNIEKPAFENLKDNWQNLLFHGDNKEAMGYLLANGFREKIDLIYIDPPFDSGANYIRKVVLRGSKDKNKISGEEYSLGEQIQYYDIWSNDNYLQFMYERLLLLKELLSETGHIFLQADDKRGHYLKILLDEVFGAENYVNDVIWKKGREGGGGTDVNPPLPTEYQNIYIYAKSKSQRKWNPPRGPYKESTLSNIEKDEKGWYYTRGRMGRQPREWEIKEGVAKKTYVSNDPKESREEVIKRLTSSDAKCVLLGDVWDNELIKNSSETDYPTEKPKDLLKLIIAAATDKEDIILDCFIGSGTTAAVAQELERRWIGCDVNTGAIQTTCKRLQETILEQYKKDKDDIKQKKLYGEAKSNKKNYSFAHYKINDYDLQLLRTEAMELAIQHIGIQRIKTDRFFEGTYGKNLVKIIDFNHPLTLFDLQLIQDELKKRPEENRNVTIVCLGKELVVDYWVEEYNKKHPVNKLNVIELRTDKKYGKFFIYKPVRAKIEVKRKENKVIIKLKDFISPSIIERLNNSEQLIKVKIPDFRSMIDVVLVDTDYNGKIFNIVYSDIPEKKTDFIKGSYELDIPKKETTIAIKIIDMLGEEVLITEKI